MEIGINIYSGMKMENIVKYLKKFGVTRTFVSSEYEDFDNVMALFSKEGITCETLHAPYDTINDMWGDDEKKGDAVLARMKNAVDRCKQYNIPAVVVHVSSGRPMPAISEVGVARYKEVFDYAEKNGVAIALENLRYIENLDYFFKNYPYPGFCWDCGHENCFTQGIEVVPMYADKLIAIHISDNTCVPDSDDHLLPFDGNIDFEKVAKQLADSGYNGTLMLELAKDVDKNGEEIYMPLTDEEYIHRAVLSAKKLAEMVEKYKR